MTTLWEPCGLCGAEATSTVMALVEWTEPVGKLIWSTVPRCVDRVACRVRVERVNGEPWPVADRTPAPEPLPVAEAVPADAPGAGSDSSTPPAPVGPHGKGRKHHLGAMVGVRFTALSAPADAVEPSEDAVRDDAALAGGQALTAIEEEISWLRG